MVVESTSFSPKRRRIDIDSTKSSSVPRFCRGRSHAAGVRCGAPSRAPAVLVQQGLTEESDRPRFGQDNWGRVLVQLSLSLLLLNVAVLLSNLKGTVSPEACTAIAVLIHLFLLSSFCWMFVEALLLYQLLVTVFQSAHTKFILKRLVFAWGESPG